MKVGSVIQALSDRSTPRSVVVFEDVSRGRGRGVRSRDAGRECSLQMNVSE
jgi:hypothetical protein